MRTRSELEEEYKTRPSLHTGHAPIITSPGKFENEALYAPWFYDAFLLGDGEEVLDGEDVWRYIRITDEDRLVFPEIPQRWNTAMVHEDEFGFVYVRLTFTDTYIDVDA